MFNSLCSPSRKDGNNEEQDEDVNIVKEELERLKYESFRLVQGETVTQALFGHGLYNRTNGTVNNKNYKIAPKNLLTIDCGDVILCCHIDRVSFQATTVIIFHSEAEELLDYVVRPNQDEEYSQTQSFRFQNNVNSASSLFTASTASSPFSAQQLSSIPGSSQQANEQHSFQQQQIFSGSFRKPLKCLQSDFKDALVRMGLNVIVIAYRGFINSSSNSVFDLVKILTHDLPIIHKTLNLNASRTVCLGRGTLGGMCAMEYATKFHSMALILSSACPDPYQYLRMRLSDTIIVNMNKQQEEQVCKRCGGEEEASSPLSPATKAAQQAQKQNRKSSIGKKNNKNVNNKAGVASPCSSCNFTQYFWNLLKVADGNLFNFPQKMKQFKDGRLLIVHGEHDVHIPISHLESLFAEAGCSVKGMIITDTCTDMLHHRKAFVQFVREIQEFLVKSCGVHVNPQIELLLQKPKHNKSPTPKREEEEPEDVESDEDYANEVVDVENNRFALHQQHPEAGGVVNSQGQQSLPDENSSPMPPQ